ncbi:MAG: DUF1211 domain-containing protein [Candidatus Eremiobacteraeota bacterium]|nr:DUF1211 domain-containing protein [Candidatus Eremiobacteraeota bacterium]MBV8721537.1 DUF1211 domain-containing protein [Candidatus Eremiobacteraeota bacterium]
MGFSLAQLSLSFVIPAHASEIYTHPTPLLAFMSTFAIVASAWYTHHRLFEYSFVPRPLPMVLNFITLALIVWLVYQLQLFVHFQHEDSDHRFAALSYIITFGVMYVVLGVNWALCLRLSWNRLDAAARSSGVFAAGRLIAVGVGTALAVFVTMAVRIQVEYAFLLIPIAPLLWRLYARVALHTRGAS